MSVKDGHFTFRTRSGRPVRRREPSPDDAAERQLVADMIELVVETVEPRVRFHARYQEKLEGCICKSIAHLRSIGRERLEPILLARAAWNDDPRLNAFFATADDVPGVPRAQQRVARVLRESLQPGRSRRPTRCSA